MKSETEMKSLARKILELTNELSHLEYSDVMLMVSEMRFGEARRE